MKSVWLSLASLENNKADCLLKIAFKRIHGFDCCCSKESIHGSLSSKTSLILQRIFSYCSSIEHALLSIINSMACIYLLAASWNFLYMYFYGFILIFVTEKSYPAALCFKVTLCNDEPTCSFLWARQINYIITVYS